MFKSVFITVLFSTIAIASEQPQIFPLAISKESALTEKEFKELVSLKEELKENGAQMPSRLVSKVLEYTIRPVMFSTESLELRPLEDLVQNSYDQHLAQATSDMEDDSSESRFVDFKLIGITKTGFKVIMPKTATEQDLQKAQTALDAYALKQSGICGVFNHGSEFRIVCVNLMFRRTTEVMVDEVKKVTSTVRGHQTQAGGAVCTASGCGTYKAASVKQMDASRTKFVKTGKKVKQTRTRNYADRTNFPAIEQINLTELLNLGF